MSAFLADCKHALRLYVTVAVAMGLALLVVVASLRPAHLARRTDPAPLLREE